MRKDPPIMHNLVPQHELLNAEEKEKLFLQLHCGPGNLPKIKKDDPALKLFGISASVGDVVRITRKEPTGVTFYYRVVTD
ncbi:MAG: DNA-directed RNA polymerase subunit RpoH/Rpb5 C-terminal domain-containing protein [Candidatus Anstonellales archaeon]